MLFPHDSSSLSCDFRKLMLKGGGDLNRAVVGFLNAFVMKKNIRMIIAASL